MSKTELATNTPLEEAPVTDYRVGVRIYNNRLRQRREALGLSQTELARLCSLPFGTLNALETMRDAPLTGSGKWRRCALALANFYGCQAAALFPEYALRGGMHALEYMIDHEDLCCLLEHQQVVSDPETLLIEAALDQAMQQLLPDLLERILNEQQRKVITLRFGLDGGGERTLRQIGTELQPSVSTERVRQIEARALKRLNHPFNQQKVLNAFGTKVTR